MSQVNPRISPELLDELLSTLRTQGLMPSSLRLIGLLGMGNNATVFSVTIDDIYHILKVYDSKERMMRELKHLRKVTPTDRLLTHWEDNVSGVTLNFFIVEMPVGRQFTSKDLTLSRIHSLSDQLVDLHRVRFKQKVSLPSLKSRLHQCRIAIDQAQELGLDPGVFRQLFADLKHLLVTQSKAFQVEKSRIHGDLWWPNVVATEEGVYLIDWDEVRRADPAEDLAKLRIHLWLPRNAFPSRNFFWSAANHGQKVRSLIKQLVSDHEAAFQGDIHLRLRFYLSLYGLHELARLAIGGSIVEPILRPSLYRLLAEDVLRLAQDPIAGIPDLRGSEYYALAKRSRTHRLDEL
jgi:hypothetical protein